MTEEQKSEFEARAKELMSWLCANCHPHTTIIITPTTAELVEGCIGFTTTEFLRD